MTVTVEIGYHGTNFSDPCKLPNTLDMLNLKVKFRHLLVTVLQVFVTVLTAVYVTISVILNKKAIQERNISCGSDDKHSVPVWRGRTRGKLVAGGDEEEKEE